MGRRDDSGGTQCQITGGQDDEGWDVLLLGVVRGEVDLAGDEEIWEVSRADVAVYAVSASGVEKLHAATTTTTTYTVPLYEWLVALGNGTAGRERAVVRRVGAGRDGRDVVGCATEKQCGESRMSDRIPFHSPLHWMHAAESASAWPAV